MRRPLSLLLILLFACVGCDQVTKSIATQTLAQKPTISLLFDTIRLQYTHNTGAFLGLGSGLPEGGRFLLLTVLNGALVGGLLILLVARRAKMASVQFVSLALIAAGGIGNMIDRVANDGRVVDFLNVGIGSLRTGIFNMADVAIMAGAIAMLLLGRQPAKAEG